MKQLVRQILRFGVVGGSAFIIDYSVMIFLTEVCSMNYLLSAGISFSVSVIYNYLLSIFWVFNVSKENDTKRNLGIFILLSIIGLGLNQIIMWLCVENFYVPYLIAKIFSTMIVMIYNFISRKKILER